MLRSLVERSGLLERIASRVDGDPSHAEGRLENVEALLALAERIGGALHEFIDACATDGSPLASEETSDDKDRVTLMTLHASKGLEFPTVVIVGCCEGLLPYYRALQEGRVEEERRLCYVGFTRARDRLLLSAPLAIPRYRGGPQAPVQRSRFLSEMNVRLPGDFPNDSRTSGNPL